MARQGGGLGWGAIRALIDALIADNDTAAVHLAGTETVTGAKNFTGGLSKSGVAVATTTDVATAKSDLLNGAGGAYDTLKELQDLIVGDETTATALATTVAGKAKPRGAWAGSTAYAVNDVVIVTGNYGGTWYCTTAHTSSSTFDPTKFTCLASNGRGTAAERAALSSIPDGFRFFDTDTNGGQQWRWSGSAWEATGPGVTAANGYQIDYAENITGTTQTIAAGGNADITGCTISVPATARPVYIEAAVRISISGIVGTPAQTVQSAVLQLLETTSGSTAVEVWGIPVGVAVLNSGQTVNRRVRLASSTSGTRTFKLNLIATGTASNGYSLLVANGATTRSSLAAMAA